MKVRLAFAFIASVLVCTGLLARAQEPAPPPPETAPVPPAVAAVRQAWLVPEGELSRLMQAPGFSLDDFAVAAMVSHAAGTPVADAEARKSKLGSWAEVLRAQGGYLADLVFKGSPRYHLDPLPQKKDGDPSASEARILALARVMTLERLTGKGPGVILQEFQTGKTFEDLLNAASQPETPPKRSKPEGQPRGRHGQGPPGMGTQAPGPGGHGQVGEGEGGRG